MKLLLFLSLFMLVACSRPAPPTNEILIAIKDTPKPEPKVITIKPEPKRVVYRHINKRSNPRCKAAGFTEDYNEEIYRSWQNICRMNGVIFIVVGERKL